MSRLELRVPPIVVLILVFGAMWGLASLAPSLELAYRGRGLLAIAILLAGLFVVVAGMREFARHRTTVNPTQPETSSAIVTTGIYGRSRNPMYLGMLLALVAWGVYLSNPVVAIGPISFFAYMNRFQIAPEERALTKLFGAPYQDYLRAVRRWI